MNGLEHKVIVYDDVCPLCNAYTGCFLKLGWLQQRSGFAAADPALLNQIDLDRARHEIPLHDTRTGQTLYGLDALFLILGTRFPVLQPLFRNRLFRWMVKQLYQVITYNRRIIAGSRAPAEGFDCAPDVNPFYRRFYIGLATSGTALALRPVLAGGGGGWYQVLPALQVLFLFAGLAMARDRLSFTGHWATIGLLGALTAAVLPFSPLGAAAATVLTGWCWWQRRDLVFA